MRFFYTIGIYLYTLGIRVAALCGHKNARLMVHGWKESLTKQSNNQAIKTAWFHAASLGEFEQARPVLEAFRERHPDYRVLVSFFSPSGYEVRKNYAHADRVIYLPMDTPRNVRRLLDTYHPTIAFFVKYEFWYNYLGELKRRNIPTYIFSSIFRPNQYFFKWYGGWFRRQLKHCFAHLFVQNEESLRLLQGIGIEHCSLAGDTRFDRVHQIAVAAERNDVAEAFLKDHDGKVLVAGSTWPPDEELIAKTIKQSNNQAVKI
ncbi:MAG: 3-deoxy-D-manno-octulosonic acid transferase, partial [Prevotella sp.]